MGTQNGGNDFPGAARPFGMVKLGPDLLQQGADAYAGYLPGGEFSGFSLMHEQGTGGAPKYGTVSQLPLVGHIEDPLSNITVPRAGADTGSVGYYQAHTAEGVEVELSTSARAGIYRYSFPQDSDEENHVLVDVSHVLPSFRGQGLGQHYEGGNLTVFADGHYEGHGIYNNGWNEAPDWTIYFCACLQPMRKSQTPLAPSLLLGSRRKRRQANMTVYRYRRLLRVQCNQQQDICGCGCQPECRTTGGICLFRLGDSSYRCPLHL